MKIKFSYKGFIKIKVQEVLHYAEIKLFVLKIKFHIKSGII